MLYDVTGEFRQVILLFAEARVVKDGPDATIFAIGRMKQLQRTHLNCWLTRVNVM